MTFVDSISPELVKNVTAICGDSGRRWFEDLPGVIRDLELNWSISVAAPFPGIEFNFVAPATRGDEPVVIKLAPPYKPVEIYAEAEYLRSRNSVGTVMLLDEDRERRAILIERLIPGQALFEAFEDDPPGCVGPAIEVLRTVLQPAPANVRDVGSLDTWFKNFRRCRDTDFPASYAEKALSIYERLSAQSGRTFYLHGDFHPGNIVTSDRAPFLVIDPKGIVGYLGYDIAVFLNNLQWWQRGKPDMADLITFAIARFAAAFGFPEREIREWAYAYMVIGAWWGFEDMPEHYDTDFAKIDIWDV